MPFGWFVGSTRHVSSQLTCLVDPENYPKDFVAGTFHQIEAQVEEYGLGCLLRRVTLEQLPVDLALQGSPRQLL